MGELPLGPREGLAGRYAIERELCWLRIDQVFDPLRMLPRFQRLVEATE